MMAFLRCELKVINFTIGWKDQDLLSTFYSLNDNKGIQSAGNLKKGSSETIRENTYSLFFKHYKILYGNNDLNIDKD
jgi:hypothetical protein